MTARPEDDDDPKQRLLSGVDEEEGLKKEKVVTDEEAQASRKNKILIFSFIALVCSGLGNKVFQKLMTVPMYNYPYTLSQLVTFVYIPTSFAYIWPMLLWGSQITADQRAVPWYKWCIMGCLDGSSGIMGSFAINYIPSGPLIILLTQSSIPISMVISKFMLGAKYGWHNYGGAAVVIVGLLLVVIPRLTAGGLAGNTHESAGFIVIWMGVLVLSCVPAVLSNVYKEKALGEADIDVVYLNGWVAVYQLLFGLLMCIPAAYASSLNIESMGPNFWEGLKCFVGQNTITNSTGDLPDGTHLDDCHTAPIFVPSYMVFNILYNIFIILILKHGSANLLFLALTLMVPLGNAVFALPVDVPGLNQALSPYDLAGLAVIMTGLVIYRFYPLLVSLRRRCLGLPEEVPPQPAVARPQVFNRNTLEVSESVLVAANALLVRSTAQIRRGYLDRIGISSAPPARQARGPYGAAAYQSVPPHGSINGD